MITTRVSEIGQYVGEVVRLQGWLFNKRSSKKLQFLQFRDGSGTIQAVVSKADVGNELFAVADALTQESAIRVDGKVVEDPRSPSGYELQATGLELVGPSVDYPISNKAHGDAFLMDHRHLWLRSRRQHTILRVRHTLIKSIRDYFDNAGFVLVDSPLLTPAACEGTTTLFGTEYFGRQAFLSQSGQLYQEAACMAFGKSYCFGPTFRAEKSKTRRHLTEFWMVEPEVAYLDLEGDMDLAEDFLCSIIARALDVHAKEIETVLERDLTALENVRKPFPRISYDNAVEQVKVLHAKAEPELQEQLAIEWGMDFGSPHETELTKQYDRPIMVYNYPSAVKAFYMKKDVLRPEVARCVDILAPEGYGEIIGGGQREDDLDTLEAAIRAHDLPEEAFKWFLDLRRYGSVPHAGFGLGLERTVAWVCGLHHVRETIPFARTMDRLGP
ncbi:MAG: asparagine--tRNA ligase [Deltaproteobacteria bacterium RIFOXYA12_FULL_58_15]|nr:MAG: asparagine--tRNA ligase [Deltaproteobacteria bacterium RIFOXYA12_FULL_58_15]